MAKPPPGAEPLPDAARTAGVARDDPMMPLLAAFAHAIRAIGSRTAGSDRVVAQVSQRIADALEGKGHRRRRAPTLRGSARRHQASRHKLSHGGEWSNLPA